MLGLSPRWLLVTILATPSVLGCKDTAGSDTQPDARPTPTDTPTSALPVPEFSGERLGVQPGYIEGGLAYAAVRADRLQAIAQSLPLPPRLATELAELGAGFGLDMRVDDVRSRFGIAPNAVVSMTLARPILGETRSVRADLARGGPLIDALAFKEPSPHLPPKVEIAYTLPDAPVRQAPAPALAPKAPVEDAAVRPSPQAIAQAVAFRSKVSTIALHSRVHIPLEKPGAIVREVVSAASLRELKRWSSLCRAIPGATQCVGNERMATIWRETEDALVIDVLWFMAGRHAQLDKQLDIARAAAAAMPTPQAHLERLQGDAAIFVDASVIPKVAEIDATHRALRAVEWAAADSRKQTVDRRLAVYRVVEQLSAETMLFDGFSLEMRADKTEFQARLRWRVIEAQRHTAVKLLAPPPSDAQVPAITALCDGALACARTQGPPSPLPIRDVLATGIYAERERKLMRALDQGDVWTALLGLSATWPNLMGAMVHWPEQAIGRGPQAAVVGDVVAALGKVEGFGLSLRSLDLQHTVSADYVAYARLRKQEADLARSLLATAKLDLQPVGLSEGHGQASAAQLRNGVVPATVMIYTDPKSEATATPRHAWLNIVDGPDRMSWLLGLPRDRDGRLLFYAEVPDLWRMVDALRLTKNLKFAQRWLSRRSLRLGLVHADGLPELRLMSRAAATGP